MFAQFPRRFGAGQVCFAIVDDSSGGNTDE